MNVLVSEVDDEEALELMVEVVAADVIEEEVLSDFTELNESANEATLMKVVEDLCFGSLIEAIASFMNVGCLTQGFDELCQLGCLLIRFLKSTVKYRLDSYGEEFG